LMNGAPLSISGRDDCGNEANAIISPTCNFFIELVKSVDYKMAAFNGAVITLESLCFSIGASASVVVVCREYGIRSSKRLLDPFFCGPSKLLSFGFNEHQIQTLIRLQRSEMPSYLIFGVHPNSPTSRYFEKFLL
jgi:hypothetical protein